MREILKKKTPKHIYKNIEESKWEKIDFKNYLRFYNIVVAIVYKYVYAG